MVLFDTLALYQPAVAMIAAGRRKDLLLNQVRELERFLAGVERRAFRIARITCATTKMRSMPSRMQC